MPPLASPPSPSLSSPILTNEADALDANDGDDGERGGESPGSSVPLMLRWRTSNDSSALLALKLPKRPIPLLERRGDVSDGRESDGRERRWTVDRRFDDFRNDDALRDWRRRRR